MFFLLSLFPSGLRGRGVFGVAAGGLGRGTVARAGDDGLVQQRWFPGQECSLKGARVFEALEGEVFCVEKVVIAARVAGAVVLDVYDGQVVLDAAEDGVAAGLRDGAGLELLVGHERRRAARVQAGAAPERPALVLHVLDALGRERQMLRFRFPPRVLRHHARVAHERRRQTKDERTGFRGHCG